MCIPDDILLVTNFLTRLSPTGADGFEGLVARLIEVATGQRFRLSGSGQQSGQDARAEPGAGNRIKVEAKRYRPETRLDSRELIAELTQAMNADPALDLWVLAASRPIIDQIAFPLENLANENGVEVLFLDIGTDHLPRLAVLMAAYPESVHQWTRDNDLTEPESLPLALAAISSHRSFEQVRLQILSKLTGTLLGYDNAKRRCNARLLEVLGDTGRSIALFGQQVAVRAPECRVISRSTIKRELDIFRSSDGNRAVVLGEEGCGKTWAVMDWLADNLRVGEFPLVLAFSTGAPPPGLSSLETLMPKLLADWTGIQTERFWAAKLKCWISTPTAGFPGFMVVCDGLSERSLDWQSFFRTIEDPSWGAVTSAILIDRPEHWRSQCSAMFGYQRITVNGYEDRELNSALEGRNIHLGEIPPALRTLISKPRYCSLVCEHFDEMKRESDFTVERLIWLDVRHRRQNKLAFPMSEDEFIAVIQGIAKRYRNSPTFELASVPSLLPCPDPDGQVYREILDALLERRTGSSPKFYAKEVHLVYGLGMLIAEEVRESCATARQADDIRDQIERWFEPHREMELKVKICEAALFQAFLEGDYPSAGRAEFLRYWLQIRNRSRSAQDAFAEYVTRGPGEFVQVAEDLLSEDRVRGAAEDFFVYSFCAHRDHSSAGPVIAQAADRWLRQIHVCGDSLWSGDPARREKGRSLVSERIGREAQAGPLAIAGENLILIENRHSLRLAGLAFKVIASGARAPFSGSLVRWALAAAISRSGSFRKEFDWLLRLSPDEIEGDLIAHCHKLLRRDEPVARVAVRIVLTALGTAPAMLLAAANPLPESESEMKLRLSHDADPCRSLFSWSDEDCPKCMERVDVPVEHAIHQVGRRLFDPRYHVSDSLIGRTIARLTEIPNSIRCSSSQTIADHDFGRILPLLVTRAPKALGNFIRGVVRNMPERSIPAQRQLSFWLPYIGPLLQAPETAAVMHSLESLYKEPQYWGPIAPGKVSIGQWVEAFALMGLLPHLSDSEFVDWMLKRPDSAFDELRHDYLARPLSADLALPVLALIHHELVPSKLFRVLRLLELTKLPLSENDKQRIQQLAASDDQLVRASCFRFACEVGDSDLAVRLLGRETYFGDACLVEENWGSQLVRRFGGHLTIEEVAHKVHPAVLVSFLEPRGTAAEEVRFCLSLFDRIFHQGITANITDGITIPAVIVSPKSPSLCIELPDFSEPKLAPTEVDAESSDDLRKFFADMNELYSGDGEVLVKQKNVERWARVDALVAAWGTSAFQWYGRSFFGPAFEPLFNEGPDVVAKWVGLALKTGPDGAQVRVRMGSFLAGVSWMLMNRSPEMGCSLWRTLYDDRTQGSVSVTAEYPFVTKDSPEVNVERWAILEQCWNDAELSQIAQFSERHGRQSWMKSVAAQLVTDPLLWRRAKGLTLASFACWPQEEFDRLVEEAQVGRTWVSDQISYLQANVQDNIFAQHWYRLFLRSVNCDEWWGALHTVLKCGDERFWTWRSLLESEDEVVDLNSKLAYVRVNEEDIKKELSRKENRRTTFCGVNSERVEIPPFAAM